MNVDAVIIVAMDDEAAPFLARASAVSEPWQVGHAVYRRVTLAGHPVLLVRSGIGLVNAAGAATSAILATEPDAGATGAVGPIVISAGTAGGVAPAVHVGDVVVGSEYINVDADARVFGYELGQVPKMPALYRAAAAHIEAASASTALASTGAASASTALTYTEVATAAPTASAVRVGLVVSSYSFVTEARAAQIIREFPAALATDMESVSLAQTCHVHGRPFLSVRGISDLCGPPTDDFLTHVDDAADRSADVVLALFDALLPTS
ncbi:5'-methylthioadenosine/S-adenosylhomocysteine nucleosidase [Subtercola lobariae]|uniref:adenosylhomocysteine nucleosidase n=1 Tax=Subtercola lobariae TaxID=1588641 RepID=A0A917BAA4_9MICO|nr:5'-methylthioadenosine/S-adenosylhomocysteine nucleosidase [Subtercola lobariae]GGF33090.1 5'-methylthioadenosine/S-adenosylhomocysteine nucleosidase [Subtercola lobariae]